MGSIFISDSQEASSIEDKTGDINILSEEILDSLANNGNPSFVGSINPPVLYSYVERFPDLVKHSINTSKTIEINKDRQELSSDKAVLDAKKSEISDENHIASREKATRKNKKNRSSNTIDKSLNNSKTNEIHEDLQEASADEALSGAKKPEISDENDTTSRKKATKNKKIHSSNTIDKHINTPKTKEVREDLQEISSDEAVLDVKKSEISDKNDIAPKKRVTRNKKIRGNHSPRRVTRAASKFRELSSPKLDIKDFFGSLSWYESNKNYFDKRLQLVLDDFELSESSDTGSGKQYYDYLLLDSRVSGLNEWPGFIRAVFYVGKGKNKRALGHTKEAEQVWMKDGDTKSKKISRILDIWRGDGAVIVLTAADGLVELEALTREALVIEALGKQRLCNKNYGSLYGVATVMKDQEKRELGATLLVKARERFIKVGAERVFAPVRLQEPLKKHEKSENEADRVALLKKPEIQLKNRDDESALPDKEVDSAVITAIATEKYSNAQKTIII